MADQMQPCVRLRWKNRWGFIVAILDWVLGGRIYKRPDLADFWSLDDHEIPERPGAYILVARPGIRFDYPGGRSPVFYIGQAGNLRSRLYQHLNWSLKAAADKDPGRCPYWPRYEYGSAFGGRYTYLRTWQNLTPKSLEDILLAKFALTYRSFPVANGQGSWKRIRQVMDERDIGAPVT